MKDSTLEASHLPHPLSKFALPSAEVIENFYSQDILESIHDLGAEPATMQYQSSYWFLMQSMSFFIACERAGIDGKKLRRHLRKIEAGETVDFEGC